MPFKVIHRKEVTHSDGSYKRKSRGRKLADERGRAKKSHDTLIDWHTGREWPLNCMRVISAWWRLNMRFQRLSGRSSGRWTIIYISQDRSQDSWSSSTVGDGVIGGTWKGKPHTAEGALGNPDGFWGPEKLLIRCSKESQHPAEMTPGPPVEHQENEKDTTLTAIRVGVKINSFCSVFNSLSHANLE